MDNPLTPPPRDTDADTAVTPTSPIGPSSLVTAMVTPAAPTVSARIPTALMSRD